MTTATRRATIEIVGHTDSESALLLELTEEHRQLDERLQELSRHISLTTAEKEEYARLKKLKLATKDKIRALGG
jgi:uncharacterized protein YdcH (DUF465 family)